MACSSVVIHFVFAETDMSEKIKILLFEKNSEDVEIIGDFLNGNQDSSTLLFTAKSAESGMDILTNENIDIIILDPLVLNGMGNDIFIDMHNRWPEIPVIILTAFENCELYLSTQTQRLNIQNYLYKHKLTKEIITKVIKNAIAHKKTLKELHKKEAELRDTFLKLERSNKDLEQFAYAISHDLNEPLRSISSYIQLLDRRYKDKFDKEAGHYVERTQCAAVRMQNMITNLLEYSRLNSHQKKTDRIDCNEVLRHALANLEATIQETSAKITSDHLPIVKADFLRLLRVFQNLIANAIKFRSDKTPEIHVGLSLENDMYLFSVKDNGIGIDLKYFNRIFVIFQRLHNNTEYPGSGIGLAICKKIIENHGGNIWVESVPRKGTTFYFTIPVN